MREGKNMGIMTTFKKPTLERGWVQASPAPLLFRQRGLSVWKHDSPIKPYTKGILFSARLY